MTHFSDDLFLGGPDGGPDAFSLFRTANGDPTRQQGVGPMGRTTVLNIIPATLEAANLAALQAPTSGVPLVLTAAAGITTALAPDGSGATVYVLDAARCVSLFSGSNLSAINFLVTGYDFYARKQTQLITGPNNSTVNSLKAFQSVLSVVPQGTSASTVSVGTSDIFGLPFYCPDAGYIFSSRWAGVLADNLGTLVIGSVAVATNLTGDTRGTYAQAGAASNGVNRLVICMHLDGTQCGPNALLTNAIGVTPA